MLLTRLLLQLAPIVVTVSVDRDRLPVGEDLVYTLRAVTTQSGTFRAELPQIAGIDVAEQTERIEPGATAGERAFVLELKLRATEVGSWRFGPVLIFVGEVTEAAPEVMITVTGTGATEPSRNGRLQDLIRRVPPPNPGANATLAIVVSADRMFQGDQLDVLTAAWFPRSLRTRLRRPPTLKPPVLVGVWSVPQPPIPGIVASRAAGDEIYDLFISHQIAYPLAGGKLSIPPARLEYAVPMTRRASGDERPVEAVSEAASVMIDPAPAVPAGYRGPQGRNLAVGYRIRSLPGYAGEVLPVEITLSGEGNLAFWPPPNVTWPQGTRAYLDRVAETSQLRDGLLGGLKTFHFLLLADSVGSIALPALSYDYFDTGAGVNHVAAAAGVVVPVLPARTTGPPRTIPPLVVTAPDWPSASQALLPGRLWWWMALLAPAAVGLLVSLGRVVRRPMVAPPEPISGLGGLDRLIAAFVPERDRGHPERLEESLRRAGVARAPAGEVTRLKLAIDEARFAAGPTVDEPSLGRRAAELIRRLPGAVRRFGIGALLLVAASALGWSQDQSRPEDRYRAREYGPAAAGFQARARVEPGRWQHWYHAAAAEYLDGHDAAAAAALVRARALAPRAAPVKRLWETLERQYEPLRVVATSPISRAEWAIGGLAFWWIASMTLLVRRIPSRVAAAAATIGLLGVLGQAGYRPWLPEGFTTRSVPLRRSPHGLAPEGGSLGALTPVTMGTHRPGWSLVADHQGNQGWVPSAAVATAGGEGGGGP